jgi:hypothetical protein
MFKAIQATIILTVATAAMAAPTVSSAPLEKAAFDAKTALFINSTGGFTCPTGFDLYVRAVKPELPKDSKQAAPAGDFDSFYFAKSADGKPAIVVSRPSNQEYVPACFKVSQ